MRKLVSRWMGLKFFIVSQGCKFVLGVVVLEGFVQLWLGRSLKEIVLVNFCSDSDGEDYYKYIENVVIPELEKKCVVQRAPFNNRNKETIVVYSSLRTSQVVNQGLNFPFKGEIYKVNWKPGQSKFDGLHFLRNSIP